MLDPQRQRLIDLVGEALALPPAEREGYLRASLATEPDRLEEALSLVGAMGKAGGFMGRPTMDRGSAPTSLLPLGAGSGASPSSHTVHASPVSEHAGTSIGRYKLLQQIGEGGFGVVFMAEQREPVFRQVALKIIKVGMDTEAVVARFEQERQALAMMDHPGIARVLDGGATESGRPFFVMELVRGDPIVQHCQKARLGMRERLDLFTQVCRAVQHAHTKGIIHRDIKPANVLVTMVDGKPVPKVIDFGIAKAAYGRLTQKTLFTEFRQMVGTPEYMSPEQADNSGVDVDARTDVYSLGVLLYELLTGVTPFDSRRLRSAAWGEMQRIIREEEPAKPSTRLRTIARSGGADPASERLGPSGALASEPSRIAALIRGDVDWIVMRCLEKERSRRYDTPEALAADVQRHLAGEPVVAAPPSAAYRARKFIGRHRVAVAGASLVVITLVAGMIGTVTGLIEARRAELDARNQAMLAHSNAEKADAQAKVAENQAKQARRNAQVAEAVNALMQNMISRANRSKEQGRENVTVREVMDAAAAELETDPAPREPRIASALARTIGQTYWQLGLLEPAERMLRLHDTYERREFGEKSVEHASSALLLGGLLKKRGAIDQALEQYAIAESVGDALGKEGVEAIAAVGINRAVIYTDSGNHDKAEAELRSALSKLEACGMGDSEPASTATKNLAVMYYQRGKFDEAEALYRKAVEMRRAEGRSEDLVESLHNLGSLQYARKDYTGAEKTVNEELAAARKLYGPSHATVASALDSLSMVLLARNQPEEAIKAIREGVSIRRASLKPGHPDLVGALRRLAVALFESGKLDESETVYREACEGMSAFMNPGDQEFVIARSQLAFILQKRGALAEAEPILRAAVAGAREGMPDGSRFEWVRHAVACELGGLLVQRARVEGVSEPRREELLREAGTLIEPAATRLAELKEKAAPRIRRLLFPRALGAAVSVCEALQAAQPSPEHDTALAAARARLAALDAAK